MYADMRTHILHEACQIAGSIANLAILLTVSVNSLARWLEGHEAPPAAIVQACTQIVLLHDGDPA
jgi:DNA-binding transcriptional regulator YdaS (Cro superfamily)